MTPLFQGKIRKNYKRSHGIGNNEQNTQVEPTENNQQDGKQE